MLESTPTVGSTEHSHYQRVQLARSSLAFNLQNTTFKDLFPDITAEISAELAKSRAQKANRKLADGATLDNTVPRSGAGDDARRQTYDSSWQSLGSNLIVVFGFAVFALLANHIIKNVNID